MPTITNQHWYDGSQERMNRLGMQPCFQEVSSILTGFNFLILEEKDSNSAAALRILIDASFNQVDGWSRKSIGGVDWKKCWSINGAQVCIGVEVQVSGRSDLLAVDVFHLREEIEAGKIDIGVIAVPSDRLAYFLTDRCPSFSAAIQAVDRARAQYLPLVILGLEHDGIGPYLPKRKTR